MDVNVVGVISGQDLDGSRLMLCVARAHPEEETAAGELFFHALQVPVFDVAIELRAYPPRRVAIGIRPISVSQLVALIHLNATFRP